MPIICRNLPETPFVLACSGGVDSIASAHYLFRKKKRVFKLFHFNHGFQEANTAMQAGVKDFADTFGLELIVDAPESGFVVKAGESVESELRKQRIKAYAKLGEDVVVCHHLNDCIESSIMNFFNGVPEYVPIPAKTPFLYGKHIHRPFMLTPKDDFLRYSEKNKLSRFITEDPTNVDVKYRRNWIRNELIPMMNQRGIFIDSHTKSRVEFCYRQF